MGGEDRADWAGRGWAGMTGGVTGRLPDFYRMGAGAFTGRLLECYRLFNRVPIEIGSN